MNFLTPHSERTIIHIGLIDNKPYFFAHKRYSKLIAENLTTDKSSSPFIERIPWASSIPSNTLIDWVSIARYCWEDTLIFSHSSKYYGEIYFKSQLFKMLLPVSISCLSNLLKFGIGPSGVYTGLVSFTVVGTKISFYPTFYL